MCPRALASAVLIIGMTTGTAMAGQSVQGDQAVSVRASALQWQDAVGLAKGAQLAPVYGDMTKAGPFVVRLSFPAGFKIAPHWHSTGEFLTVVSGSLHFGHGNTFDLKGAELFSGEDFVYMPAGHPHFLHTVEPTVLELHGTGPFDITYVNAADDPRRE